jgi:hypothetical protein
MKRPNPFSGNQVWNTIAARVSTRSAMAPLIVALIIVCIFAGGLIIVGPDELQWPLFCLVAATLAFFAIWYSVFGIIDRNRLHSENHQLRRHAIDLISQGKLTVIDPTNEDLIGNPLLQERGQDD